MDLLTGMMELCLWLHRHGTPVGATVGNRDEPFISVYPEGGDLVLTLDLRESSPGSVTLRGITIRPPFRSVSDFSALVWAMKSETTEASASEIAGAAASILDDLEDLEDGDTPSEDLEEYMILRENFRKALEGGDFPTE